MDLRRVHVIVIGRVQGVGFRYFVLEQANTLGLAGWVRNLPNGTVEAEAEGTQASLENWLKALAKGPSLARVKNIDIEWKAPQQTDIIFEIV